MQRTILKTVWQTTLGLGAMTLAASLPLQAQQTAGPPALTDPFMRYFKPTAGPSGPQQSVHKAVDGRPLPMHYTNPKHNSAQNATPQENHAYGSEGIQAGQTLLQPFGTKGESATLAFGNGVFSPPANEKIQPALARLAMIRANAVGNSASVYALILLNGRLDDGLRAQLQADGVELFAFYPRSAYQARIPVQSLTSLAALSQVRWIGQPTNTQKMTPELTGKLTQGIGTKPLALYLSLFGPDPNNLIRQAIEAAGGKINLYDPAVRILQVDADRATLGRLLDMDAVLHVEEAPVTHTLNERSMSSIDVDWLWGSWDPAPSTTPVHVGLTDSGSYVYHEDFSNLINGSIGYSLISGESWYNDLDHHGTHVSGTMMGEGFGGAGVGVEAGRYRGIAAELTSHGDPFNHPDLVVAQVFDQNGSSEGNSLYQGLQAMNGEFSTPAVQVFNLSGGGGGSGQTGTDSLSIKTDSLFQNNILPVIAAGNSGSGSDTILYPGCAKGALTVGAVYSDDFSGVATDNVTGFSSRGPTGDGRVKPDVCAPGAYIDSTLAGTYNGYTYGWAGTSMATPHVTGMAAGFIGHYGFPAWATKTAILASAINVGGQSIYAQGEGKIDGMLAHYSIDGGWSTWWSANGGTGSLNYVDFTLGSAVANLKVVMTYPDVPPASGASIALVNDLDLYLQTDAYGGSLTTDRGYNWVSQSSVDTVEVINVANAPAGHYRIKVYTYNQASGSSQNWAVTAKTINSSTSPHLSASLSTPYAVQPGESFYAEASTSSNAYVASGVNSALSLGSSGASLQGLWYNRPAFGSSEWFWYPNPDAGTHGSYSPYHMNEGNIPDGYSREAWWQVGAGSSEGTKTLSYTAHSINSTSSTGSSSFIVDGTAPSITNIKSSNWGAGTSPTVTATAQDTLSGLQPAYAYYRYSTDGGSTWSSWTSTACTGSYATTAAQTITATSVPFGQNNANNQIEFGIYDAANNFGTAVATITSPVPTSVTFSSNPVVGGSNATGTVTLSGAAPTGGAVVSLSSANSKAHVPATVTVPAGSSSATFTITTSGTTSNVTGNITATYAGGSASGSLTVRPIHIQSFTLSPNPVKHKQVSTGTVTLEIAVPSNLGSLTVSLSSSKPKIANPAVSSLTFTTGQQTLTFPVNALKAGKATITATAPDGTAVSVSLKVK